jgi:hypothetical protein
MWQATHVPPLPFGSWCECFLGSAACSWWQPAHIPASPGGVGVWPGCGEPWASWHVTHVSRPFVAHSLPRKAIPA